ncbi:interleukin-1 receptor-associated kinase 1-binding protein 1 isoform X2 [Psammomys obesus]|uniref:interleukin-1 receptor-associated kinase 1-binding protein 1 isoform X2 n=1 Tax=Psammomys obesus TaxID=48139 RepID=UPI002452AAEA|nr:interleukin-1 receptor-associated kinase 1-binding protein 1 isoform X2 [Psammomys obesus]
MLLYVPVLRTPTLHPQRASSKHTAAMRDLNPVLEKLSLGTPTVCPQNLTGKTCLPPHERSLTNQNKHLRAENVTVMRDIRRMENAYYHMEAEVCITFTEFGKMQTICNFLVEKLDSSVVISPPDFYHTAGSVENLRRQACLTAVENAWRKAHEVCDLVGQTLGKPLLIKEEETREWEGQVDDHQLSRLPGSLTVQQKIKSATIHAASKVFITFEVKSKEKKKKHL